LAKGKNSPNDCDLFWVTDLTPDTKRWRKFRHEIENHKASFYAQFNLQLNVVINTRDEFIEGSEFKTRIKNRPIIEIKTAYNIL
jgi:hypothetical protein